MTVYAFPDTGNYVYLYAWSPVLFF